MRRFLALLLIPVLLLCVGCKKNQPQATEPTLPGAVQTAGNITVFVPEGWEIVPDDENLVRILKGDSFSGSYVKLHLHPNSQAALPAEGTCENVQVLEAQTFGAMTWTGFSGTKTTGTGVGTVTYLITQVEGHNFLATIWYDEGSQPISIQDADVQAILGNLSASVAEEEPAATDPTGETADEGPHEGSDTGSETQEEAPPPSPDEVATEEPTT